MIKIADFIEFVEIIAGEFAGICNQVFFVRLFQDRFLYFSFGFTVCIYTVADDAVDTDERFGETHIPNGMKGYRTDEGTGNRPVFSPDKQQVDGRTPVKNAEDRKAVRDDSQISILQICSGELQCRARSEKNSFTIGNLCRGKIGDNIFFSFLKRRTSSVVG